MYTEERQFFVNNRYITVRITGRWHATSPDIPELDVTHENKRILIAMVAEALEDLVQRP